MISLDPHAAVPSLPLWAVLPFGGFVLSIALFPLVAPHFWERHYGKVSAAFGVPVAAWFLVENPGELLHTGVEYVDFIILLGSLFTISGGILLRGTVRGTPWNNCVFLGIGAVIANVCGTTGASMLLIRPLLRANAHRRRTAHIVIFFIFVVSNAGGMLTPIGDPPLFLGYLRGVPFFWTLENLWLIWLFAVGILVGTFYVIDRRVLSTEGTGRAGAGGSALPRTAEEAGDTRFSIEGKGNVLLLAVVIGAVFLPPPLREILMAAALAASVWLTPSWIRRENGFTWHPIEEVAILFAGIFATMIPALLILKARGSGIGVAAPAHFFWATGILSSFLDNAPTYLSFLSLAQGLGGGGLADVVGVPAPVLRAISIGAVLMGATTYIGNAPNFMVKSIAESAGVRMPSFFGYMAYSVALLFPVFGLITLLFL
jgi:Na+/H+ antiporter NhaD/arsenite permease-like protein